MILATEDVRVPVRTRRVSGDDLIFSAISVQTGGTAKHYDERRFHG